MAITNVQDAEAGRLLLVEDAATPQAGKPQPIRLKPSVMRIRAEIGGIMIADSRRAFKLIERGLEDVYYFPKDDVRMDLLIPSDHVTACPKKGLARYWDVQLADQILLEAAWAYDEPFEQAAGIAGYVAFSQENLDGWWEDDLLVGGTAREAVDAKPNPLAKWILKAAWEAENSRVLTDRFIAKLNMIGMQVYRSRVVIRTMHPMISATAYQWSEDAEEVTKFEVPLTMVQDDRYTLSPLPQIYRGEGGVRRRITANADEDDYPILADLRAEGATDYAAMPMRFSDGQINAITIATRAPGGFTTEHLGWLHEIIPALARYYEVHARQRAAMSLMQTFLGPRTGKQVLEGRIHRGDGENIHAVIWFSDLRNSTPIAEQLGREAFLDHLNKFFDCMAGAVIDNGGEVLRFVGDAVLAIFPIDDGAFDGEGAAAEATDAARRASLAVREVARRISEANEVCTSDGRPHFDYGIGLHVGDVMYGNIGTEARLEFTVIGTAANEASRVEGMTKELGLPVVVSETFAALNGCDVRELGTHRLRGVGEPVALYTLPDEEQPCA